MKHHFQVAALLMKDFTIHHMHNHGNQGSLETKESLGTCYIQYLGTIIIHWSNLKYIKIKVGA